MDILQNGETVLDVKNLRTVFFTSSGLFKAVDDVSFNVRRGETLAIVGESGCGKSVSALSIMRLVPDPPGKIVGGSVMLEGKDLLTLDEEAMREFRKIRVDVEGLQDRVAVAIAPEIRREIMRIRPGEPCEGERCKVPALAEARPAPAKASPATRPPCSSDPGAAAARHARH